MSFVTVGQENSEAIRTYYESPYQLMPVMARNIQLHLAVGMLLIVGYVVAIVAGHLSASPPVFLR